MQAFRQTSITIPTGDAAHIARLLARCAEHEEQRAQGKVTFPLIVMRELSLEARHWSRYLESHLAHPASTPR